jgi:Tol biopolymer transport system component
MTLRHLPLLLVLSFLATRPLAGAELVSLNATGTAAGSNASLGASLSADGRFVAFQSSSTDLIPGGTPGPTLARIFVRDLLTGTTTLVSDDGRFVVFGSSLTNLVSGVTYPCGFEPCYQVYLCDLQAGTTRLLSATPAGDAAGDQGDTREAASAQISGDGRVVVFQSPSSNLSRQLDGNNATDIFSDGAPAPLAIAAVPTLSETGLALLTMMIATLGLWSLRR